jgi:lipoate-protein ligase A
MVKGFEHALGIRLSEETLNEEELEAVKALRREKFANNDWTFFDTLDKTH